MSGIWPQILAEFAKEIPRPSFETWFVDTQGIVKENTLFIYTKNEFHRDWLDSRYKNHIEKVAEKIAGAPLKVEVISKELSKNIQKPITTGPTLEERVEQLEHQMKALTKSEVVEFQLDTLLNEITKLGHEDQKKLIVMLAEVHKLPILEWLEEE